MPLIYTDSEIATLLQERKVLPFGLDDRAFRMKPKAGHTEGEATLLGDAGHTYRLILRQNAVFALDFSVILAVRVAESGRWFRLRRCNGRSHEHTNRLEGDRFGGFHIHEATERYQALGVREDAYAEPTNRYSDFDGAVTCMMRDAYIELPPGAQTRLF